MGEYIAGDGTVTREEKHVHTGEGWSLISTEEYEYDGQKRLIKTTRGNGRVSMTTWGCCGPLMETDEDGVMTTCGYNSARQLVETIRSATATTPERIISHTRDSSGRSLQAREDVGSMHRVLQRTYDLLGRAISETDERGRTTTHSYQNHGLKKVTTLPTGAQEITEKNRDGSLHYQALAGRRPVTYSYSPLNNRCTAVRRYSDTMEPGYTETDWNGRTLAEYAASPGTQPQLIASRLYNARGLITESAERGVRTLYEYDSLGNTIQKMLPLADPPSIFNSRIVQYAYAYESRTDGVYRVVTETSYDAEGQPLTSSRAELVSALSATLESRLVLTDIYGKVTAEWTEYDGATKRKRYKIIPTSTITAEVRYTDGFITYRKDAAGVETLRTIVYTATGSTLTETDGRGNTVTMARDTADRVIRLTDGAGYSIETEYDQVTGKRARVTNENGKTTCYKYDNCGRISAVYGTAARPVCYGYDANGNLSSLTTFRAPGGMIVTDPTGRTETSQAGNMPGRRTCQSEKPMRTTTPF